MPKFELVKSDSRFVVTALNGDVVISPSFSGEYTVRIKGDGCDCTLTFNGDPGAVAKAIVGLESAYSFFVGGTTVEKGGN